MCTRPVRIAVLHAIGQRGTWSMLHAACVGILVAAAAAPAFAADVPIVNPVIVTNPAGWKYKDGKTSDKISGKAVVPQLAPYLSNGFGIGIARVDGTTNYFTPVWKLTTKNHKSWSLKIKKAITMRYNAKNGAFVCTIWTQLPPAWAVYLYSDDTALIPAGSFAMGDTFYDGDADEMPVHAVYISAFYMDKCEVTYTQWTNVYTWAITNGYTFDNAGSGKATNHPVQTVNWYDCVKWCNARSEMKGLTPCYYTDAAQTQIYRIDQIRLSNNWVNWTANGYRLPTEAEWEKAAHGGTPGHEFPWSDADTIQHARANYESYTNANGTAYFPYDTSPTRGYHPSFTNAPQPYTSPAGYFAPNGYGLCDMAGNVWEWTWDWYDDTWYTNAGATQSDTPGPGSGTSRVLRGGSYNDVACYSRVAERSSYFSSDAHSSFGFRSVRR